MSNFSEHVLPMCSYEEVAYLRVALGTLLEKLVHDEPKGKPTIQALPKVRAMFQETLANLNERTIGLGIIGLADVEGIIGE